MSDGEGVVDAVFKRTHAYGQDKIHSDGDNIDLDDLTPTTTSVKRPIEIVTTTESFEWSSSKDRVVAPTLKIPKWKNSNKFKSFIII
ncbi:unnamed protein product [Lactuca virosa]|uniref:Uncharacterized protein n=1 Tax=Lactuca virosa TaxID=75947 RepID=A0AAU9MML1_9ASTR|nr:unnamed protein product [Lactuca virosa]